MIIKSFAEVRKVDENTVMCKVLSDIGFTNVKRTFRKHSAEIRNLRKQGIYCFEIQGTLYYYTFDTNGIGTEYKKPELFREVQTDSVKSAGRGNKEKVENSIKLPRPKKVKPAIIEVKQEETKEAEEEKQETVIRHKEYETIKLCIENDIPVYLVGDAGCGKSHTLEQIANDLRFDFYSTNSVQQEYKLTGFIDAGGKYHETEFYNAFKFGGVFLLDEMDASIPEVLTLLNTAIANGYFEFPNGLVRKHENFRCVAAGNTVGSGADEMYTGRMVLDMATLDRFCFIEFDYDRNIELHISGGNVELVDFIDSMREQAKMNGIRATFSYRCINMVTKLEKSLPLDKVLKMAVFKGMEKDTINCFAFVGDNKYGKALKELQK